jgi:hypothetical protein
MQPVGVPSGAGGYAAELQFAGGTAARASVIRRGENFDSANCEKMPMLDRKAHNFLK